MAGQDFTVGCIIALIIIMVALFAYPGYARVKGSGLEGYWAGPEGSLFEIVNTGPRTFTVRSATADGSPVTLGRVSGIRGVTLSSPAKKGNVELGGRRINWADGDSWFLQGVKRRWR